MKRQTAVVAALVVAVSVLLSAQNQEFARIIRNGDVATLTAFGPRPVDLAAKQLADEFRIAVNVEDPVYMYRDDVQDITTPAASRAGRRLLIPRTALLEVGFRLRQDGALQDVQQMVHDLADAANAQLPFQYRV